MSGKYVHFNLDQSLPNGDSGLFSKIKTVGNNINSTTYIIIAVIILFGVIAGLYYYYYISPQSNAKYKANKEHLTNNPNEGKNAELLFFFADWCPHCKTAKPIWNDLKAQYENKTINGYHVVFTEINCSEETAEVEKMMNQYSVEGYPTIKLLKDGQVVEYDAKPTKETLTQFLNTVL